eukprot:TRINITY_DN2625_c2_g1_i8.p1 TRINITY_DN2625_c2_g1~~TRINITY_DN2625_c2_g1_i8.p1  ORF type:complete len:160 (+),score=50.58 TRINITY_DN2625_c2_g1_i8:136-615(+)
MSNDGNRSKRAFCQESSSCFIVFLKFILQWSIDADILHILLPMLPPSKANNDDNEQTCYKWQKYFQVEFNLRFNLNTFKLKNSMNWPKKSKSISRLKFLNDARISGEISDPCQGSFQLELNLNNSQLEFNLDNSSNLKDPSNYDRKIENSKNYNMKFSS